MSTEKGAFVKETNTYGGVEKAVVAQIGSAELLDALKGIGLAQDEFREIVSEDFEDVKEPSDETLIFNGIPEEVRVRTAQIGDKQIEVAHCRRKEDSKEPPSEFDLQLRHDGSAYHALAGEGSARSAGSYKILVGLNGEGVLRLPKTSHPAGMLYAATAEADIVLLRKGTVAIIQAGAAWSFESSKGGLEYLYISYPPHSSSSDTSAVGL